MRYTCPICGYPDLDEPSHDPQGHGSHEICPCCGTQFGYTDASRPHLELRMRWIMDGAYWHSTTQPPPAGWNAQTQLRAAGF